MPSQVEEQRSALVQHAIKGLAVIADAVAQGAEFVQIPFVLIPHTGAQLGGEILLPIAPDAKFNAMFETALDSAATASIR